MIAPLEISDDRPRPAAARQRGGHDEHDWNSPEFDADAMDAIMVNSMLEFPAETEGSGNQILEPEILARRHQAVQARSVDHRLGGCARPDRRSVGLQRPGSRPADHRRRRRQRAGRTHQQHPDGHRHPLARHPDAERPGRCVAVHPGSDQDRRDLHLRVHGRRSSRSACTTPTCTRRSRWSTACSLRSASASAPTPVA